MTPPTQVSVQFTDEEMRQVEDLKRWGFGNRSGIMRIAIDRMHGEVLRSPQQEQERHDEEVKRQEALQGLVGLEFTVCPGEAEEQDDHRRSAGDSGDQDRYGVG